MIIFFMLSRPKLNPIIFLTQKKPHYLHCAPNLAISDPSIILNNIRSPALVSVTALQQIKHENATVLGTVTV